jgi:hypothetical protein
MNSTHPVERTSGVPDIPLHLLGRPTSGGLVVPWITPVTAARQYLFGKISDVRQRRCLLQRRCQVCWRRLTERAVLFARESDLPLECTGEPAVCPPCAAYSGRACPMLSGRRSHYRAGQHPALADRSAGADQLQRQAAPAEPWYAVWIRGYEVISHPAEPHALAASWQQIPPLRIRPLEATA